MISCIMTVFNEGPLLLQSVDSILGQTHGNWELVIVDDGSAEATREILAGIDDPRIRVIHQANDGQSSARNRALEQVRGDYVCFLDADDTRPTWALESFARVIARDAPDVVLCRGLLSEVTDRLVAFYDADVFDAAQARFGEATVQRGGEGWAEALRLALSVEPQPANKAVRRDLLRARRIGFPNGHVFEDIYFHAAVLSAAASVAFVQSAGFTYHKRLLHRQTTSAVTDRRFDVVAVMRLTLDRFAREPDFADPAARAALLAACLKIVAWSEWTVSHFHRFAFRDLAAASLALVDPAYLAALDAVPGGDRRIDEARAYAASLLKRGGDPAGNNPESPRRDDRSRKNLGLRLWSARRA